MASTFSDLGIELMSTGENAGTWGDKTNTNLQIVEKAIAGYVEKSIAGGAQTTALSITDGTTTESDSIARHAVIKLTGSITGNQIVTVPDSIEKVYIITNGTSGAYTVQFKTASGTGITFGVSEKTTRLVYSDGTNLVDAGFGGALDIEGRELVLDADGDTTITADTDDQIDIKIGGTDQIKLVDGAIVPVTDNDIDLGTSSLEFKDAFFDGTVTADAFAGPLTGDVTGNVSGTAATVTTAAQSNITSLGTLTTLTVDNIITNGSTIGHTSDTDLITLADGIATVAGEVSMTTLDIGGTNVTSTAAELNLLDDKDATFLAVPGKLGGTNFTNSLLIGHATTGTLNDAQSNTGVGIAALDALTSGDANTGVGLRSLSGVTSAVDNTAMGSDSGKNLSVGSNNTVFGKQSLQTSQSGNNNVAMGDFALEDSTASNNTALGSQAGKEISTSSYNIVIGRQAGDNITTGSGNVIIGTVDAAAADSARTLKIAGYDGSTTTTWITGDSNGIVTFAADVTVGDDLNLTSDASVINFGADSDVTITHDADDGLVFKSAATADDNPFLLTLQTGETDIAANDVLGAINFQAPDEGTGTDAILVAAGIEAVSEGDFAADNNATKLSFKTGASEAAAEKMSLSSAGVLTVSSTITADSKDVILGKFEGTNFARSILIGHATTGTISSAEDNLGIGDAALNSVTSGDQNICLGSNTGTAITTGGSNVYIGRNAGSGNATGSSNFALGVDCLEDASFTGTSNVAIGRSAGAQVESGNFNILMGQSAGDNITTGHGNLIIGANVDAAAADGNRQLKIAGYDGTTTTTWISGDSDGDVTFAHDVILANDSVIQFGDAGEKIVGDGTNLDIHSSADIDINAAGINIKASGTNITNFNSQTGKVLVFTDFTSGNVSIETDVSDKDLSFKGNDGGSVITALTLDMSDAGTAIFNHDIVIPNDSGQIKLGASGDLEIYHDGSHSHIRDAGTGDLRIRTSKLQLLNTSSHEYLVATSGGSVDIYHNDVKKFETTSAGVTVTGGIIISDAGNIGSASDTDAIAIGADGDVTLTQDLELQHDGAILSFGANDEVTLTHVHNDGLLLNTDMQLQFRDSAINIRSDADGDLDINADDEVEINSTLIDINGNVEMSGTLAQAGVATFAVAANVAQVAITSSSNAVAWDASAAANAFHVTTENTTFSAPSNAVEGAFICLEINYNGSHTIAFNTVFEFAASTAPTTTDTDGKTDILVFRYNGAVWQEVGRTLNLSES